MSQLARLPNERRDTVRVSVCAMDRGARVRLLSELFVRIAAGRVVSVEKPPMVVVVARGLLDGRFFFHNGLTAVRAQSIIKACVFHAPRCTRARECIARTRVYRRWQVHLRSVVFPFAPDTVVVLSCNQEVSERMNVLTQRAHESMRLGSRGRLTIPTGAPMWYVNRITVASTGYLVPGSRHIYPIVFPNR